MKIILMKIYYVVKNKKYFIFVKYRIKNLNTSKTVMIFKKLIEEFKNRYISNNIYFMEIYLPDETDNFINI